MIYGIPVKSNKSINKNLSDDQIINESKQARLPPKSTFDRLIIS